MVDHFSTYIYQKRGFFYLSRRVPKEVQQCHSKQRIVFALNTSSHYLFPKYCNDRGCNSNSASAALNKWLKQTVGPKYVIHSFRHSMRDRLRAVYCSSDMIDQIGGWMPVKIGETYGEGFGLSQLYQKLSLMS